MTANTLISQALKTLGVLGEGDTLGSDAASDGLVWLNQIVDRWRNRPLTMPVQLRTQKTLTSGTATYTVGTGGDISLTKPTQIDEARLVLDTSASVPQEVPLRIFTDQAYAAIPDKTLQTLPAGIHYDHGTGTTGTITIYPVPDQSTYALVIYTRQALTAFADLTTDYTLPYGLAEALETNLAKRLAIVYGKPLTPELNEAATESFADYCRANSPQQVRTLRLDPAFSGHGQTWGRRAFLSGGYD